MLHYRLHHDPKSSHQQILALVRRLGRSPILDVGAAQGFLGRQLEGSGLVVDAIEPNTYWAERAEPHYRSVFATTVEDAPLEHDYRVIVCADVLEHVVDPLAVLGQLREAGSPDAVFVISLPNVAHIAVRLMLLAGLFPPMERGILDRTHLHFWTLRSATDMLRQAGLEVVRARPTGVPLDELWPSGEGSLLFTALARLQHLFLLLAPRLFGYQWVLVARREGT